MNPITDARSDADDAELVRLVQQEGDRGALDALLTRHQPWIYNVALRMVYLPQDAEDASQEILIKVVTKLGSFAGRSSFRTWLYRIAVNHLLNLRRTRAEEMGWTFDRYGQGLDAAPDTDLPDPATVPADVQLLVDEARPASVHGPQVRAGERGQPVPLRKEDAGVHCGGLRRPAQPALRLGARHAGPRSGASAARGRERPGRCVRRRPPR